MSQRTLLTAALLGVMAVFSWQAYGQFGGQIGQWQGGPPIEGYAPVICVVPKSRDALLAYSSETCRWHRQPIKPKETTRITPAVGTHVAAVRIDDKVFAFSALAGIWDSITVPADVPAAPYLGEHVVAVRAGNQVHAFGSRGVWDSITVGKDSKALPIVGDTDRVTLREGNTLVWDRPEDWRVA